MSRKIFRKLAFSIIGLAGTAIVPVTANAVTFSCDGTAVQCNGNEYAISVVSQVGNTYQVDVSVKALSSYSGNQWTDLIRAIQLKDIGYVVGTGSIISAPVLGSGSWAFVETELSSGGCIPPPGGGDRFCAFAAGSGAGFTLGSILTWRFQFNSTGLGDFAHLKYLYVDSNGAKVGDLGSFDQDFTTSSGGSTTGGGTTTGGSTNGGNQVPEPASSLVLLGLGLLGLGFTRRLKQAA